MKIRFGCRRDDGRPVEFTFAELFGEQNPATWILGASGGGKTKLCELVVRAILEGHGLCLIDCKGDLARAIERYACFRRFGRRTIVVDPDDTDHAVGLNFLECPQGTSAQAWSEVTLEGLKRIFGQTEGYAAWIEEWLPTALGPLIERGYTLQELLPFVSNERFREAVFSELPPHEAAYYRSCFAELAELRDYDAALRLAPVRTRAKFFAKSPMIQAVFGQRRTAIDWHRVMDKAGIVIVKAHQTKRVSQREASLVGLTCLQQVMRTAYQRSLNGRARPFFLVCDEWQTIACPDFAEAAAKLRAFNVRLILANQTISQLRNDTWANPFALIEAVKGLCDNRIVFAVSGKDATELVPELFPSELSEGTREVKDEIETVFFRPVKTYEEIVSVTDSECWSHSRSTGFSHSGTDGVVRQPDGLLVPGATLSLSATSASASSESSGSANGGGTATTRSIVPFYELEEDSQVTSRTFTSLEELKQRFATLLQTQRERQAIMRIGRHRAIPVVVAWVPEVPVLSSMLARFRAAIVARYARPVSDVLAELHRRVAGAIAAYEERLALEARQELRLNLPGDEDEEEPPVQFTTARIR